MPSWDDLRVFLAVHRAGTLGAAAGPLGVDATTVGRRVAALEAALGTPLFHRGRSGLVATAMGDRLLPVAEAMEAAARGLHTFSAERGEPARGEVVVTSTEAFARTRIVPLLPELRARHPDLDVVVIASNRDLDIAAGEADVAMRLRRPSQAALIGRRVGEVHWGLYAHRAYLERRGRPEAGWARHDVVGFHAELGDLLEARWLAEVARDARVVARANTISLVLAGAVAGLGLAVLPHSLGDGAPELVRVGDVDVPPRPIWLVFARPFRDDPRVRAVLEMFAPDTGPWSGG